MKLILNAPTKIRTQHTTVVKRVDISNLSLPAGFTLTQTTSGALCLLDDCGRINVSSLSLGSPEKWLLSEEGKTLYFHYKLNSPLPPVNLVPGKPLERARAGVHRAFKDSAIPVGTKGEINVRGVYFSDALTYHYLQSVSPDSMSSFFTRREQQAFELQKDNVASAAYSHEKKVYVIGALGQSLYRLGVCEDIEEALPALQAGNPFFLLVLFSGPVNHAEKVIGTLYRRYAASRLEGEWFRWERSTLTRVIQYLETQETEEI